MAQFATNSLTPWPASDGQGSVPLHSGTGKVSHSLRFEVAGKVPPATILWPFTNTAPKSYRGLPAL
jgi:hypothetical protein